MERNQIHGILLRHPDEEVISSIRVVEIAYRTA